MTVAVDAEGNDVHQLAPLVAQKIAKEGLLTVARPPCPPSLEGEGLGVGGGFGDTETPCARSAVPPGPYPPPTPP
ncbi:hypothetical protein AB5I41_20270 [Sphingomonas sp. MMS24-JH45]